MHARRFDLRSRADRFVGRRDGDRTSARLPEAGVSQHDAIWFRLPPRSTEIPAAPPRAERAGHRARDRRRTGGRAEGATILDACRVAGKDVPDALLSRHADAGERLPRLRRRGRGRARAGAGVFAQGGGRDEGAHQFAARADVAQSGAGTARFVCRSVDCRRTAGAAARVRRGPGRFRLPGTRPPSRSP